MCLTRVRDLHRKPGGEFRRPGSPRQQRPLPTAQIGPPGWIARDEREEKGDVIMMTPHTGFIGPLAWMIAWVALQGLGMRRCLPGAETFPLPAHPAQPGAIPIPHRSRTFMNQMWDSTTMGKDTR